MSRVTSNFQVSIPEAVADRAGIHPGDELEWVETAKGIQVRLQVRHSGFDSAAEERLKEFDKATRRQQERQTRRPQIATAQDRGWTREDH